MSSCCRLLRLPKLSGKLRIHRQCRMFNCRLLSPPELSGSCSIRKQPFIFKCYRLLRLPKLFSRLFTEHLTTHYVELLQAAQAVKVVRHPFIRMWYVMTSFCPAPVRVSRSGVRSLQLAAYSGPGMGRLCRWFKQLNQMIFSVSASTGGFKLPSI